METPATLVLASTSPYRRAQLERLGLPFDTEAPGTDEAPLAGETPASRALRLARAKAAAVAERRPGARVIGSDQVAALGDRVLGKPGGRSVAIEQLSACSGREVVFYTAVVLLHGEHRWQHVDRTRVQFRRLSHAQIADYVDRDQPYDCAGAFRSEGLGIALFERIDNTDPTALMGLPLIWVCRSLAEAGLPVLSAR
jgi:septum formation protein